MAKKKVYITSLHMRHGGCEFVISSLANALIRFGFDVEILCIYNFGETAYPLDERVKITYLTKLLPNRATIKKALQEKRIFHLIKECFYAVKVLLAKHFAMKKAISDITDGIIISTRDDHDMLLSKYGNKNVLKIAQLHHDNIFDRRHIRNFQKHYNNIDYFTLLSPKHTEEIRELMKGYNTHTKCVTIPNFIENLEKLSNTPPKKQIIAAGRLHSDKDFYSLLRIWKKVLSKHGDYILKIAGEGELETELKAYAAELKITNNVDFCGALPHDELLLEMSESVCHVMTSVSESFSLVLLEAMSQGTPSVSYNVRVGPQLLISNGENGFLIDYRNEDKFADKVCELIENTGLREKMSLASLEIAPNYYVDNVMKLWMEILE